jgi:hypothetical protein
MTTKITKETLAAAEKHLTPKQRAVLECLLQGKNNGQIVKDLYGKHAHHSTVSKLTAAICKTFDREFAEKGESLRLSNDRGQSYRLRDELVELYVRHDPNHPSLNPASIKQRSIALEEPDCPVSVESPFYIERPPLETRCFEAIKKPGALVRIRAAKQMGKSSLISRVLEEAVKQKQQVVSWSLLELDQEVLDNLEQFLRSFCWEMSRQLDLENSEIEPLIADAWDSPASQKIKCGTYFEDYLLPRIEGSLVVGLDDVDALFSRQALAAEFFTMLRKWHEYGIQQKKQWGKLRFVIAYSTEDYAQLDINQSPFNVGLPYELPEFTLLQIRELAVRHGLNWAAKPDKAQDEDYSLTALHSLVGGHPYLIRLAMYAVAQGDLTIEQLLQQALTDAGLYNRHLLRHWDALSKNQPLAAAMKQVVSATEPVMLNPGQKFKLHSMGLIKYQDNVVVPRCRLYQNYFGRTL